MRIKKVKLHNYACFYDADEFELGPGINFIVGKNNSGKTMLIDALSQSGNGKPHLSVQTIDAEPGKTNPELNTRYEVVYEFEEGELLKMLKDTFYIPLQPKDRLSYPYPFTLPGDFLKRVSTIRYFFDDNQPSQAQLGNSRYQHSISGDQNVECYEGSNAEIPINFTDEQISYYRHEKKIVSKLPSETAWAEVAKQIPNKVFRLKAERHIAVASSKVSKDQLSSDASNLAQVLLKLQLMERKKFTDYEELVMSIFPSVREVFVDPGNDEPEIKIGYYDPDLQRSDLAVSISECGAGLVQVMAMLYVVVTSVEPQVILIDEPQSFLHPGAVRKLLQIFQQEEYAHHQYIMTTHSPTAIASVQEKTILLLEREDMISNVSSIDARKTKDLEVTLQAVGARLSDVFGMDNIIWVEGATDEICFPMIMNALKIPYLGTKVLGVVNTGDFANKKHGRMAVKIYHQLSSADGLLPPALGFVFDGDMQPQLQELAGEFGKSIFFLRRQNFESYFIDFPEIIAGILNTEEDGTQIYTESEVSKWVEDNKKEDKYYSGDNSYDEKKWLQTIDGAKFLENLFRDLIGKNLPYDKVRHGEKITRRILCENPDHFSDIGDLIKQILRNTSAPEN